MVAVNVFRPSDNKFNWTDIENEVILNNKKLFFYKGFFEFKNIMVKKTNTKRCKAKTKNGTQCKRNANFYYCNQHWSKILRSRTARIWYFIVIFATLAGLFQDFIFPTKKAIENKLNPPFYWECEQDKKIRGIILDKAISRKGKLLNIQIGVHGTGSVFSLYKDTPYNGEATCFLPLDFIFDHDCTLQYRIDEKNQLLVSAEIYDMDGCLAGKIEDNQFILNQACQFTWNADNYGIEIVDSDFDVIFSLDFRPPDLIAVQGLFFDKDKFVVIGDGTFSFPKVGDYDYILDSKKKLKPMFEYFGKDWHGKRVQKE